LMDETQRREIREVFGGDVLFDCPMSRYTTFRAGGDAEALCTCRDLRRLRWVFSYAGRREIPLLIIGRGSNLLVKDTGFHGVVARLGGELAGLEAEESDEPLLTAGGGAALRDALLFCRERGLSGMEFLSGIPGSVGGAVAMNAGAWGEEIGGVVRRLVLLLPEGDLLERNRSELQFGYRSLSLSPGAAVVGASIVLHRESKDAVSDRMAGYLERRRVRQPLDYPSAGSVFRNPTGDFAGRLIEDAGLKGERIGGAMVSPKHANFIVNVGGASAGDILELMDLVRERVLRKTGVGLEPEIRVVG
jgi:UDP-N-acetylmuramate dehydrogenase